MYNVRAEDRISAEELRTRFNLNKIRLCLQIKDYNVFSSSGKNGRKCMV